MPAEWKMGGFGSILASFWEAPGLILGANGRPKTKQNLWYFLRVSRGGSWGSPWAARGGPGPPAGLPGRAFGLFGGTRGVPPARGNLAKTEPGGRIHMVFFG